MSVTKFLKTDKVLEYLEKEVGDAAKALGIFRIETQVWEDENNPRDGFLGYAMQQELEWPAFDLNGENNEAPSAQILVHEFLELMDQIWYSIGLSQLYARTKSNASFPDESSLFWLHYNSSLILSSIASDRIRKFIITRNYDGWQYNKNDKFTRPFHDFKNYMKNLCEKKELGGVTHNLIAEYSEQIEPIVEYAEDIVRFKKIRNKIVHEISTKKARELKRHSEEYHHHDALLDKSDFSEGTFQVKYNTEFDNRMFDHHLRIMKEYEDHMVMLKKWYLLLQKIGDLTFQGDYMIAKWNAFKQHNY